MIFKGKILKQFWLLPDVGFELPIQKFDIFEKLKIEMQKSLRKFKLGEEPADLEFWLTQTPQQRLSALEEIRDLWIRLTHHGTKPGFQRVYKVTKHT